MPTTFRAQATSVAEKRFFFVGLPFTCLLVGPSCRDVLPCTVPKTSTCSNQSNDIVLRSSAPFSPLVSVNTDAKAGITQVVFSCQTVDSLFLPATHAIAAQGLHVRNWSVSTLATLDGKENILK
jgi:hypothetical protein